jgi:glutamine cyclotransferase
VLYYTIGVQAGAGCTASTDTLYAIDPTNGNTTTGVQVTVNGAGVNAFVGSAFVNGTLYGFTADGHEYVIDPATGAATLPKNTTANILSAGGS